jgi:glutaredoxin
MLVVYSKNNCPECVKAMSFLDSKRVAYEVVKVDEEPAARQFLLDNGHRAVPQIYLDGKLFVEGGFKGLSKLTDEDFARLLK